MNRGILAALVLGALPSLTFGQNIEITPMAGYRFGGTLSSFRTTAGGGPSASLEVADSAAFGAHLGYRFGDFEFELLYARQATGLETPGLFTSAPVMDVSLDSFQAGGNYLFATRDARVVPFIGFGLGFTILSPERRDLSDETRFSASFAGGAKFWLSKHVGLRVEARYFLTVFDNEVDDFCGSGRACDPQDRSRDLSQGEGRAGLIFRF